MSKLPPPTATTVAKPHWGFSTEGKFFRSEVPVDNLATKITLEILDGIKRNLWSPAEVILELTRKPDWYQKLWPYWLTGTWGGLDRYHLWPLAPESNSVTSFLKRHGTPQGPWLEDEKAWAAACDRYERQHGLSSRAVKTESLSDLVGGIG
jgi:hypothetical protein